MDPFPPRNPEEQREVRGALGVVVAAGVCWHPAAAPPFPAAGMGGRAVDMEAVELLLVDAVGEWGRMWRVWGCGGCSGWWGRDCGCGGEEVVRSWFGVVVGEVEVEGVVVCGRCGWGERGCGGWGVHEIVVVADVEENQGEREVALDVIVVVLVWWLWTRWLWWWCRFTRDLQ